MSEFDPRVERPQDDRPVSPLHQDDVPSARLLAHDLEHLMWDDDGEDSVPPPD